MNFGLAIKNFVGPAETPDVDAILAYAERAEALGFESLWAWDHVILGVEPSFPILDAVGILTAIAARTRRIKLGTGVLVLPLRNPTVAAKALGTLDAISKGRLLLGVAAGWYAREFDAVGVPFKQRGRLFERNLEILTRLWTEDRVTLQADEFNLREAVMRPRPVQRPRPPILVGGYVDAVLKRAATLGDGWLTYFYTPESFTRSWTKVLDFARAAGRDPATLTATNQLAIHVGRSREDTEAPLRHWLQTEWDVAAWSESTIEHAIRGSVEECVAQLQAHMATGVHRIILIPYRYEPAQVEVIAREILPRLAGR
ncbi:MAG: TIGR03619 family F420-dependent LLM class oxidoreductase [Candidatus Rokubacteria bacterium]|nr:TIGR03619 family F420-dependent LLM class oxidoreductase [Candidatus Rokubacteria bacterium]